MTPTIIFEDENFLVIDKPYGITVNNSETTKNQETIQNWIGPRAGVGEFYEKSGIVHRLDKDTSGVLVIAKTESAYLNLKTQFQNRETVKKYLALVHGLVDPPVGTINAPIERSPFNRMRYGVFVGGREAVTSYRTLGHYGRLTLVEVTPKTGRTHQIRVHLKYIKHEIVSDPIYGGRKQLRDDLKFCPRLFLHAQSLTLKHPISGELMTFTSPLPTDLESVISSLSPAPEVR